ncbi:halocyanin domain-containing protein [Halopenitus persicus]|uniref:Halocyanin domain-containing protein n=1 Tax=Halopenitus persicus TaxID=1048396 RepID=A0A1H3HKS7_9EURY|nr:halocyanin domain-containing protein [Halopenitus persicus]SDY15825.1 halocyanin domain-containing protein [Halopenitus persicus]
MERYRGNPSRRAVLAAVGTTGLALGAGCLSGDGDAAASGGDDWLESANNYDGVDDHTGESTVTVAVGAAGGLAFDPAAVRVDVGTDVVWEWTGEGGQHDVVEENGRFESDLHRESGATFTHRFEETGTYRYACTPHQASGMRGAVEVVE